MQMSKIAPEPNFVPRFDHIWYFIAHRRPLIVQSFCDHDRAINHDGQTTSLLTIQVTELIDGIFIGCSVNHMIVDGTSYHHFLNTWCEILKLHGKIVGHSILHPPVLKRWIPGRYNPIINLPFTRHNQSSAYMMLLHWEKESSISQQILSQSSKPRLIQNAAQPTIFLPCRPWQHLCGDASH